MAWRSGSSLSRSLISTATALTFRSSPSISSLPHTPLHNLLGSMPLHSTLASARLTSHISVEACHCRELSQGT
ncbi:hypothetical protein ACFX2I_003208 [Malus domestica]